MDARLTAAIAGLPTTKPAIAVEIVAAVNVRQCIVEPWYLLTKVKGVRFSAVVVVIAVTGAITGVAHAARAVHTAKLGRQLYSFPGGPGAALLSFTIERDRPFSRDPNRPEVARHVTLACVTGSTPPAGIPADQAIVLTVPGEAPVIGRRSFAYSGPATASAIGSSGTAAPTTVVFRLAFTGRVRSRNLVYPTGVKGSFTSGACRAPVDFSFPNL